MQSTNTKISKITLIEDLRKTNLDRMLKQIEKRNILGIKKKKSSKESVFVSNFKDNSILEIGKEHLNVDEFATLDLLKNITNTRYKFINRQELNKRKKIKFNYRFGAEVECFVNNSNLSKILNRLLLANNGFININSMSEINTTKKLLSIVNEIIIDEDCSLYNNSINLEPFEIKTHIIRGDYGLSVINNIFKLFRPKFNRSCGLHVHVETPKNDLDFREKIAIISPVIDHFYFSALLDSSRIHNEYCNFLFDSYYIENILDNNYNEMVCSSSDHYVTTSISRHNTIEFRHMHGNKNLTYITKMINLYMTVVDICKRYTLDEIYEITLDLLSGISKEIRKHYHTPGMFNHCKKCLKIKNKTRRLLMDHMNKYGL